VFFPFWKTVLPFTPSAPARNFRRSKLCSCFGPSGAIESAPPLFLRRCSFSPLHPRDARGNEYQCKKDTFVFFPRWGGGSFGTLFLLPLLTQVPSPFFSGSPTRKRPALEWLHKFFPRAIAVTFSSPRP